MQEHDASYEALVGALERGEPLGACIGALEAALPEGTLPAAERQRERELVAPYVVNSDGSAAAAPSPYASEFDLTSKAEAAAAFMAAGEARAAAAAQKPTETEVLEARLAEIEAKLKDLED